VQATLLVDADGTVGLISRAFGPIEHYRIEVDQSEARLISKTSSGEVILGSISHGYAPNTPFVLTLDCIDSQIRAAIDNDVIGWVNDFTHSSGNIGLWCEGVTSEVVFSDVIVSNPLWVLYHEFIDQPIRLPGSRVRVHSGSNAPTTPLPVTVEQLLLYHTSPQLPEYGCKLRIVDPEGTSGHSRVIRPSSIYISDGAWWVARKSDGTGCILLKTTPDNTAQTYRLSLSYDKDITSIDPETLVFKEKGSSETEYVHIDIPWVVLNPSPGGSGQVQVQVPPGPSPGPGPQQT
jgi:hypothetical protein